MAYFSSVCRHSDTFAADSSCTGKALAQHALQFQGEKHAEDVWDLPEKFLYSMLFEQLSPSRIENMVMMQLGALFAAGRTELKQMERASPSAALQFRKFSSVSSDFQDNKPALVAIELLTRESRKFNIETAFHRLTSGQVHYRLLDDHQFLGKPSLATQEAYQLEATRTAVNYLHLILSLRYQASPIPPSHPDYSDLFEISLKLDDKVAARALEVYVAATHKLTKNVIHEAAVASISHGKLQYLSPLPKERKVNG